MFFLLNTVTTITSLLNVLNHLRLFLCPPPPIAQNALTALPTELFQQVASYLPPDDLKALRLVTRNANAKTISAFARAHFACKLIRLTNLDSLRRAVRIAQHEHIGPAIQTLVLFVDEPRLSKWERWFSWKGEQTEGMQARDEDVQLLGQLFRRLAMLGKVQKIVVTDISSSLALGSDPDTVMVAKSFAGAVQQMAAPGPRPFEIVIEALQKSGLRPKMLEVAGKTWNIPMPAVSVPTFFHMENEVFSSLTSLSLTFLVPTREDLSDNWIPLTDAIASMAQLAHLSITFFATELPKHRSPTISDALMLKSLEAMPQFMLCLCRRTLPQLQTLHLKNHLIDADDFIAFLSRSEVLEGLRLEQCAIMGMQMQISRALGSYLPGKSEEALSGKLGGKVVVTMDSVTDKLAQLMTRA